MTPLTRKQVRAIDRFAIERLGVAGIVLMENAGRGAAEIILGALGEAATDSALRAAVLCGGGNNGGDGYVIARHLHNAGVAVELFTAVDPAGLTGDAAVNHGICAKMGLSIEPLLNAADLDAAADRWKACDVLVDALLGTGFTGQVRPHMAAVISRVNAVDGPLIVAVDVPSGLDCEAGLAADAAVEADLTVTFVGMKTAFETPQARGLLGRVVVTGIGVPSDIVARAASEPGAASL